MTERRGSSIESKIAELEKKIDLELKIKAGAESIKSKLQNRSHVEQAEISLNESNKRLNFLLSELEKLKTSQNLAVVVQDAGSEEPIEHSPSLPAMPKSPLYLSLASTDLSGEKIAHKLSEIQCKISIEQSVALGAEKMMAAAVDKKQRTEAEATMQYSKSKIALLKSILGKYSTLNIEPASEGHERRSSPSLAARRSPNSVTGKLKVRVGDVSNLNLTSANNAKNEGYCTIRIDNILKAETKLKSKLHWNEEFEIKVEKASEIEISLLDKNDSLKGILFFRLPGLFSSASDQLSVFEENFDLEPCGSIRCHFQLERTQEKKSRSKLARRKVIKRKVHAVMGHGFVATNFYHVVKCSVCSDFLLSASGYQCQSCSLVCHKKCHLKVVSKCISMGKSSESNQIHRIKFNIPHRFETVTLAKPSWCCHCGHLLPIAKKSVKKCLECGLCSHEKCCNLVPDFCGLSLELIDKLLSEEKPPTPKVVRTSSLDSKISELESKITPGRVPTVDDFVLISVLGKGNFGKVMLVEEKSSKKLFAMKVLKKQFILENDELESLQSEKRIFLIANMERHPFLINLHSCFQSESRIYFVMEYVSGGDLMWHIQHQSFSEKQAKLYAAEVLLGLEFFHKNNVVYRDLKLDNILLGLDGHVKIADYGLCKENMPFGAVTGTFCGTPEFMAPEILLEQNYTRAVDWWAFGVLIYEMLLGQSPFKGHTEDEIFQSILSDPVYYPPQLSLESLSILQKESDKDTGNFDEEFTSEEPVLTPVPSMLHQVDQEEFNGFSYVAEWVKAQ